MWFFFFFWSSLYASIMLRYAALLSWKQTHDLKLDLLHVLYSLTSEQWKKVQWNFQLSPSYMLSAHNDAIQVWPIQKPFHQSITSMKVMLEKGCTNISSHLIFIKKIINWCYQLLTVTLIIQYFKSSQYLNIFIILHYKCHISGLSSLVKYMWPTVCRMNY